MKDSIFPESMLNSTTQELTLEGIASKFDYFFQQIHLLHLQTMSYAEHNALNIWDKMPSAKDEFLEKLMGYEKRRLRSYTPQPISDYSAGLPSQVISNLKSFAEQLEKHAANKGYSDIENLAQSLSGEASKVLYLLTLS